jgi:hypothetical protein
MTEADSSSRAEDLARRYPLLRLVPAERRSGVLRAAIFNPLIIGLILCFSLIAMPPYLTIVSRLLNVDSEPNFVFKLSKVILLTLPPMGLALFLLSRWIMPLSLRRAMRKRGFDPDAAVPEARKKSSSSPPRWKKKKRPGEADAP